MQRYRSLPIVLALFLGGTTFATEYYVRTDGSDAGCTGLADAAYDGSGSGEACAKRKISAAEAVAVCGDNVNVRAGEFYEAGSFTVDVPSGVCSSSSQKKIIGAGSGNGSSATRLFMSLSTEMTCAASGTFTYACTIPADGIKDSASRNGNVGLCMTLGTNTVDLEPKTSRKYTARTFICLTPTSATTGAIDYNDDGVGEANLDSLQGRGFWYAGAADTDYIINPWGGIAPSSTVRFFAPTATGGTITIDEPYITLQGMTIYKGSGSTAINVTDNGDNVTVSDVTVYGGTIASGASFFGLLNASYSDIALYNHTRRILNKGCGELGNPCDSSSNDFMSNTAFNCRGDGATVNGLVAIGGQEGGSFNGRNFTITNFQFSSFTNHGFRMDNLLETATFENGLSYNNQEGLFIANCMRDVTFKHFTTPQGLGNNGWPGLTASFHQECTNDGSNEQGTWRWKIYNSIVGGALLFSQNYLNQPGAEEVRGNAVAGGASVNKGWVFDYNAYANSDVIFEDRYYPSTFGAEDKDFSTLAAWRAHVPPDDGCGDCTDDPNSVHSTTVDTNVWVNPSGVDLASDQADYHLKAGSFAINVGHTSFAPSTGADLDGVSRDITPDAGAYEFVATDPACNDNADNDGDGETDFDGNGGTADSGCTSALDTDERLCGDNFKDTNETCDGTDLNSQTCITQGFLGGTLSCAADCGSFVTNLCQSQIGGHVLRGVTLSGGKTQ